MLDKINLISISVASILLFTFSAAIAFAADAATKESGQAASHGGYHGHHCPHKMSSADLDKDGKISKEEFMKHHEAMFDKKDINKDGFLDDSEMQRMKGHMHKHEQQKNGGHAHDDAKK